MADPESAWIAIERVVVAALLGETEPRTARDQIRAAAEGRSLDGARLDRILSLIADPAPFVEGGRALHELRNQLAGLHANLDLAATLLAEPQPLSPEAAEMLVTALKHALASSLEMGRALRAGAP